MSNGTGTALDADYFNRLETGLEVIDTRAAELERGVATPVSITYATTITPDASAGAHFRCIATGNLTVNAPVGGTDGQTVIIRIKASGADRTIAFSGNDVDAITLPSGKWWRGELTYDQSEDSWLLED